MRKIVAFAVSFSILAISSTALADTSATDTDNSAATTKVTGADAYSTVLITDSENRIVYVDQDDDTFDASVDFLIKTDPGYGKYNVKLGGEDVEAVNTYFYVGVEPEEGDVTMKRLQNEETPDSGDTYKIGYYAYIESEDVEKYNSLKVGFDGNPKFGGVDLDGDAWDKTHYSGSGDLYIIFQLNDVPSAWKDSVTVFLSTDKVGNTLVNNNQQEGD